MSIWRQKVCKKMPVKTKKVSEVKASIVHSHSKRSNSILYPLTLFPMLSLSSNSAAYQFVFRISSLRRTREWGSHQSHPAFLVRKSEKSENHTAGCLPTVRPRTSQLRNTMEVESGNVGRICNSIVLKDAILQRLSTEFRE